MSVEHMTAADFESARAAQEQIAKARGLVRAVERLLDGTHVERPTGETVAGALELADLWLSRAAERLREGSSVAPRPVVSPRSRGRRRRE